MKVLLLCAALALPVNFIPDRGGVKGDKMSNRLFWSEYNWLTELLTYKHPNDEFLIIPVRFEVTPPGWEFVPFGWRGHLIYRRTRRSA